MSNDVLRGTAFRMELLPHLGAVHAQFSAMETAFDELLWHLIGGGTDIGRAITTEIINISSRINIFRNVVRARIENAKDKTKLLVLADTIDDVCAVRNRLVHGHAYGHSPSKGETFIVRRDQGVPKHRPITLVTQASLSDLSERMWELSARCQQFMIGNPVWHEEDEHFPWHDIPRPPLHSKPRKGVAAPRRRSRRRDQP